MSTVNRIGLDFDEVYLEIEEEFDIRFADDAISLPSDRVGDLFDVAISALRSQRSERFDNHQYEQKAWEQYKSLLCSQLGLRPEQIVRSAYFVRDLGIY